MSASVPAGVAKDFGHLLNVPERSLANMARKLFVVVRRLERDDIVVILTQGPERGADEFVGFGHRAEDMDQHQFKGEDFALRLDFEVLKRLTGLHDLRLSDLNGVSPIEWYVPRFVARWPEGRPWPESIIRSTLSANDPASSSPSASEDAA